MALWFSATAVVPALKAEGGLDNFTAGLFTSAVQAGFVIGTLCFALTGIADRFDPRRIFLISAEIAALANLAILALDPASPLAITLRLVTGICMAGIYPIGMKLAASWARGNVGLLVGALVGALALGSASPHLFVFAGDVDWRFTLILASASGAIAGALILAAAEGPAAKRAARFKISDVKAYWTNRGSAMPISAISAICGSSTLCGPGSASISPESSGVEAGTRTLAPWRRWSHSASSHQARSVR
ncbi:MAG: MFS transporter [Alphaproteobacteria bacterium]|nr:MFS transporter [Alphaproteobacteria bacterium]